MRKQLTRTLAAVTLAVAMPMGLVTQAEARPVATRPAANIGFGCRVVPLAPQKVFSTGWSRRIVNYPTYAWCQGGRRVFVQDRQFARRSGVNYLTGWDFWSRTFPTWPNVVNRSNPLPYYTRQPVGTYHVVRFRVSNGMFTSPWSSWESSPTTWVWN